MKQIMITVIISGFWIGCCFGQVKVDSDSIEKQNAQKIWELAIAAKGGREKLFSVNNIVVSSESDYLFGLKRIKNRMEDIYIFPNKRWSWNDNRPSNFGLVLTMYNWETNQKYVIGSQSPEFKGLEPIEANKKSTGFAGLIDYFLETKWNKPNPIKTFSTKLGSKKVNVVQTEFLDNRADFYFDLKSHFLVRAVYYENEKQANSIRQMNYKSFSGIMMPTKIVLEASDANFEYDVSFKFNVDYDNEIFSTPPRMDLGPEIWKAKTKE